MLPNPIEDANHLNPAENEEFYYAIAKLSESVKKSLLMIDELPKMRLKMSKSLQTNKTRAKEIYQDIQTIFAAMLNQFSVIRFALLEMEEVALADFGLKLQTALKSFNLLTEDYSKLCERVKRYLTELHGFYRTTNATCVGRLMNRIRMGYYPTDTEHVSYIMQAIQFPQGMTTNLLDPCCGCGIALRLLAEGNNCYTYGVELDEGRAHEAQTRLHRVGIGSFFHARISHEAFHLLFLNPPYIGVVQKSGGNIRNEKRFLVESLDHLMHGGLLVYVIPYYRLTPDVCRFLADNFEGIAIYKFYGEEFKKFQQVVVFGTRQKRTNNPIKAEEILQIALHPEEIPELNTIEKHLYTLPPKLLKVQVFKGAEFNVAELAEQLKKSNSLSKLFEKSRLDEMEKRPLLPLNIGQIGLIGGSGLINGLIECETPHIIKGRIIKEVVKKQVNTLDEQGEEISEITETTTNKMVFNLLTPEGFKRLN